REGRRVVHQVAGDEVVAAVEYQVVVGEHAHDVARVEVHVVPHHPGLRVARTDSIRQRLRLRPSQICHAVRDLAVQVRQFDNVRVHDPDAAGTGGGEVGNSGTAEPPRAHDEPARVRQPALCLFPETGQAHLAAIPSQLRAGEGDGRFDEWSGHASNLPGSINQMLWEA